MVGEGTQWLEHLGSGLSRYTVVVAGIQWLEQVHSGWSAKLIMSREVVAGGAYRPGWFLMTSRP